jgi:hypothetical protein
MRYESTITVTSKLAPDVSFTIERMSLGHRIELIRRIRELGQKIEFLDAGSDMKEKIEATLLANEVDRLYLQWGLREVQGLEIDGQPATPELLVSSGPEDLCREITAAIKSECGLNENERKN